jgi:hypothetical protein
MKNFLRSVQGYWMCVGWIVPEFLRWVCELAPELQFWKWHNNLDDHLWYAERVNGRIAMLVLSVLLILEFVQRKSIWDIVYGM